jgi:glycolate oxidase
VSLKARTPETLLSVSFKRLNKNLFVEDLSVPMSKIPETLRLLSDLSKRYGIMIPTLGHAGDGNLHPCIAIDASDPEEVKKLHAASFELLERVVRMGGTVTGEHGIGLTKAPYMMMEHGEVSMGMMRAIKRLFDPNNILNPGKMALDE